MGNKLQVEIGRRIRKLREKRGLTQEQLATKCGCHRTYAGMVERAEKSVSVAALARFAKALDTTLSKMLEGL
jgi:transcriptional regulator with XRE-family HTH domain